MLLVAILEILSNEGSLVGIERFARRHREVLNELLGTDWGYPDSVDRSQGLTDLSVRVLANCCS